MAELVEVIQTVGFPIAMVLCCIFFIYKLWEQSKDRENKLMELISVQNEKFEIQSKQLETIALTQERIIERLERIEYKEGIVNE